MNGSKTLLSSILQAVQKNRSEVQCILKLPLRVSMNAALKEQLHAYDALEQEAQAIASNRGWLLNELDPGIKSLVKMRVRSHLILGDINSKAAELIIGSNTKSMIRGIRNQNSLPPSDERIHILSQKLLDNEMANIRQMQGFL